MQIYVTTIGSQLFTQALAARTVVTFTKIRVGSAIISNYTQSELVALSDVVNFVYEDDSPNFSYTIQNSNLIVWDALLDTTVGNFNIGNYGVFDSNNNLLLIVALDAVIPKYNSSSSSGANAITLYPIFEFTNIVQAINLTIAINNAMALPVVANRTALPAAGTTENNAFIVLSDDKSNKLTSLVISDGDKYHGMAPRAMLGSYNDYIYVEANYQMAVTDIGKLIEVLAIGNVTVTLPPSVDLSTEVGGQKVTIFNASELTYTTTIKPNGSDQLYFRGVSLSGVTITQFDTVEITYNIGTAKWELTGGSYFNKVAIANTYSFGGAASVGTGTTESCSVSVLLTNDSYIEVNGSCGLIGGEIQSLTVTATNTTAIANSTNWASTSTLGVAYSVFSAPAGTTVTITLTCTSSQSEYMTPRLVYKISPAVLS